MTKKILLAGGRSPAALELARLFHADGHEVFVADTTNWCMCKVSRAVRRVHEVPWPNVDPVAYADALLRIVQRERIDLLIPTFEEVFHIAKAHALLGEHCEVFADEIDKLHRLHNKWEFNRLVRGYGLDAPETRLLTGAEDLGALGDLSRLVLKPAYSRFSSEALIRPTNLDRLNTESITPERPWIAQEFADGSLFCTYSVARHGRLVAHATYPVEFNAGKGTAVTFRPIEHRRSLDWVRDFVVRERFHGQIAFDFIEESEEGRLLPIECNPRTTSGVHLFGRHPRLTEAILGNVDDLVQPLDGARSMLSLAMLALRAGQDTGRREDWKETFSTSRDVTYERDDPLPMLMQFVSLGWLYYRKYRYGRPLKDAGTLDLEWNGEA